MKRLLRTATASLFAVCCMTGCKPDKAVQKGEVIGRGSKAPGSPTDAVVAGTLHSPGPNTDAARFGSIKGQVLFSGKPPARVRIDMSMDPACGMSGGENLSEQFVVNNGKLANVYLYLKGGVPPTMAPAGQKAVLLDQKGCRYTPHVIAVQQGGYVQFANSDPTMHNIHTMPAQVGNETIDVSQGPRAQPQVRQFNAVEVMMPVRCNNHPWMNAFINVAPSPYFAVSAADGSFTIAGVPPGTYTLAAVHEKMGEQDVTVTVPAKNAATATVTFAMR